MTDDVHDMPLVPFDAQGLTASGELLAGELKATVAISCDLHVAACSLAGAVWTVPGMDSKGGTGWSGGDKAAGPVCHAARGVLSRCGLHR